MPYILWNLWCHLLQGSTALKSIRIFCCILLPCLWYNIVHKVVSSSVGGSDYLSQISLNSVQYSWEAKKCRCWHETSGQENTVKTHYPPPPTACEGIKTAWRIKRKIYTHWLTTLMSETQQASSRVTIARTRRTPADRRISHLMHYNNTSSPSTSPTHDPSASFSKVK